MAKVKVTNLLSQDLPLTVRGEGGAMETVLIKKKSARLFEESALLPDIDTKVAMKIVKKESA